VPETDFVVFTGGLSRHYRFGESPTAKLHPSKSYKDSDHASRSSLIRVLLTRIRLAFGDTMRDRRYGLAQWEWRICTWKPDRKRNNTQANVTVADTRFDVKKVPPWVASQSVGIEHAGATGYHWDTRKQIRRACDTARL
jgi:hypothetical protein